MKNKTIVLNQDDREMIDECESFMASTIFFMDNARSFKLHDYIVANFKNETTNKIRHAKNTYGAIRKWQVVYVCKLGFGYIKELDCNGKLIEDIKPIYICENDNWGVDWDYILDNARNNKFDGFSLDPDYADHIILQIDGEYDPMTESKNLKLKRKQILEHNKSIRLQTNDYAKLIETVNKLNIGTTYWLSSKNFITILSKETINNRSSNSVKDIIISTKDSKGKTKKHHLNDFYGKALYTDTPKSLKKSSDSI